MKTIAIIQARMTSSRLAGKIIKNFSSGLNMLDMQIQTLSTILDTKNIYIATTNNQEDNIIEEKYATTCNIYRGSEDDVLSRFLEISKFSNADNIIRIASDNPFIFKEGIEFLINEHQKRKSDYTTFAIEGKPSMLVPCGLYVEIITAATLLEIEEHANITEKEHVTYALYTRLKNKYNINLLDITPISNLLNNVNLRYTVDTTEDFLFIDKIIKDLNLDQIITLDLIKKFSIIQKKLIV